MSVLDEEYYPSDEETTTSSTESESNNLDTETDTIDDTTDDNLQLLSKLLGKRKRPKISDEEYQKKTISIWLEGCPVDKKHKMKQEADRIYQHISYMPERSAILQNAFIPFDEKCILFEKMEMLDVEPSYTAEHFRLKKEIKTTLDRYNSAGQSSEPTDLTAYENKLLSKNFSSMLPIKTRILQSKVSDYNKAIILEKFIKHQNNCSAKLRKWITYALGIVDYQVRLPIKITDPYANIASYLQNTKHKLDKQLYGMNNAKERLLEILATRISNPNAKNLALGIVGPPGVGKCLHPDTKILMFPAGIKTASEIQTGDLVMGDDSRMRIVKSVNEGYDTMYKIIPHNNSTFTCNSEHILTMYNEQTHRIRDISVNKFLSWSETKRKKFQLIQKAVDYDEHHTKNDPFTIGQVVYGMLSGLSHNKIYKKYFLQCLLHIKSHYNHEHSRLEIHRLLKNKTLPAKYIYNSFRVRKEILRGIMTELKSHNEDQQRKTQYEEKQARQSFYHIDSILVNRKKITRHNKIITSVDNYTLLDEIKFIIRSLGLLCSIRQTHDKIELTVLDNWQEAPIKINPVGFSIVELSRGQYCGMTLNRNGRFMLKNCIVTHNTELVQALSRSIELPYEKINLGGSTDPHYFLGHGYTYEGSEPGVIVKALGKMKSKSGIIYLDEFDKIDSHSGKIGKVAQAFLHISDPVQQNDFQDQYLNEIKIDLSNIWFIYSFNDEKSINPILRSRIPIIKIKPYTTRDKYQIVKRYIIPKELQNIGMSAKEFMFSKDAIQLLIKRANDIDNQGMRAVKHLVQNVLKKLNMIRLTDGVKDFPLSYKIKITIPFEINTDIIEQFVEKKKRPYSTMYI